MANRVAEINEVTSSHQWRHCPGKLNPADDASRGMDTCNLLTSRRWWNEPEFLWKKRECWPQMKVPEVSEDDPETRKEVKIHQVNAMPSRTAAIQALINYYSNWSKLQISVTWLVRFVRWLRNKRSHSVRDSSTNTLTLEELNHASDRLVQAVQREHFKDEIDSIIKHTSN